MLSNGRNENKAVNAGLTPIAYGDSVSYAEANLVFYCRKIYQHPFSKEGIVSDIQDYYINNPKAYPPDEKGEWKLHWVFVGEILEVKNAVER